MRFADLLLKLKFHQPCPFAPLSPGGAFTVRKTDSWRRAAQQEPYPSKSTGLAQATKGSTQTPGGRLGCGRQAGACAGWSLRSNEPSIKAVGFVGKAGLVGNAAL